MKQDVNIFLAGLIVLLLISMMGIVMYYKYTYSTINSDYAALKSQMENITAELNTTLTEVRIKEAMLESMERNLTLSTSRESKLGSEYEEVKSEREKVAGELEQTETQLEDYMSRYTKTKSELEDTEDELGTCKDDYKEKKDELDAKVKYVEGRDLYCKEMYNVLNAPGGIYKSNGNCSQITNLPGDINAIKDDFSKACPVV